jgi:hypothetical protein
MQTFFDQEVVARDVAWQNPFPTLGTSANLYKYCRAHIIITTYANHTQLGIYKTDNLEMLHNALSVFTKSPSQLVPRALPYW